MNIYCGIDCGATNCRIGLIDEKGNLLGIDLINSPLKQIPDQSGQIIKQSLNKLLEKTAQSLESIKGLGIGVPGPLDMEKGLILPSANLGNTAPINLTEQLKKSVNTLIYIDRDTNVALIGEAWKGAAVGFNNVLMLTVGTGIGGAIMVDGKIDYGTKGLSGEMGHIIVQTSRPDDKKEPPVCGLGHKGCLEGLFRSTKDINELSYYLGIGLANFVDIFNPQQIIVGGGRLDIPQFLPKAIEVMKQYGMKPAVDEVRVEYAKLGDLSGVYGGAKLAMVDKSTSSKT